MERESHLLDSSGPVFVPPRVLRRLSWRVCVTDGCATPQAIVYEGQDKNPEMCRVLLTHESLLRQEELRKPQRDALGPGHHRQGRMVEEQLSAANSNVAQVYDRLNGAPKEAAGHLSRRNLPPPKRPLRVGRDSGSRLPAAVREGVTTRGSRGRGSTPRRRRD
ncbi:hypothetical protein HPB52_022289 [Rhipicephalus sanguineus]|uniref:Transcription factor COE DNA-binding domain-containing protein n=1 Tax=Rhipicephalus sanguineus TaxID=34632 RepID=A0A9D4YQW0_RHISA|nr:hypothetical protein HPB52_022289 [Rhipicephalus sanguineus]